jgi:hypothetical protein
MYSGLHPFQKIFAATAIMQLAENGKRSLDDDVGKLIEFPVRNPGFPNTNITFRMLLSHHRNAATIMNQKRDINTVT